MLLSFRPHHGRSTKLARQASTCLQRRHSNIAPNRFRYLALQNTQKFQPQGMPLPIRTSLQHITSSSANDILYKALDMGQKSIEKTLKEMETSLAGYVHDREGNGSHFIIGMEKIDRWIYLADRHTHSLMNHRCQYMALCATEILLNTVWNHPSLRDRAGLSLQIMNVMLPVQKRERTWPNARPRLLPLIAIIKRYNPEEASIFQPRAEEQQLGEQRRVPVTVLQAPPQVRLRRVQALINATDRLFMARWVWFVFQKLTKLTDEVLLVTRGLEMMDSRMWLDVHLSSAHEYLLSLRAEIPVVDESPTPPLISPNRTELESIMKLYDLYSSIYRFRAKHGRRR